MSQPRRQLIRTTPRPERLLVPTLASSTLTRRSLLLGAGGIGLLTACGGDGGGGGGNEPSMSGGATGAAKKGGVLRVARPPASNAETLDPASSLSAYEYLGAIYNRLVKMAEDGSVAPDLAESWEMNDDATEWTLTLRSDVTWHDGKPFTSKDAAYTIQHMLDPATKSPQAGVLSPFLSADGITAPDDTTLKLALSAPNSEFITLLMNYNCYVIPDGSGKTIGKTGIGTGPFKLVSFEAAGKGEVEANPDYFEGRPVLDRIEFTGIANIQSRVNALMAGQVDLISQTNLDFATIKVVQQNDKVTTATVKNAQMYTMPMLCSGPPFDDPEVRRAFKLAYDPQAVIDLAIHGLGTIGNNNPVPPTDPNYLDYKVDPDPAQAKSILQKAGVTKIDLYTSDYDPVLTPLSLAYQSSVKEAGLTVNIKNSPADSYYTSVWMKKPFMSSYWYTGRPIDQLLNQIFRKGSSYNESAWADDSFSKILDDARKETDEAKRRTLYQDAQKLMVDDNGTVLPFFADRTIGLSKEVVNYKEFGFEFDYVNIGFKA